MKNKKRSLIVLFGILFLTIFTTLTNSSVINATSKNYIETIVDNFPSAKEKEFSSPESVINSYVDAIRNNDFDQLLKCLPIKEHFETNNLENYIKCFKLYTSSTPIPNYDLKNYLQLMQFYLQPINRIILLSLYADTPDFDDVLVNRIPLPISINLEEKGGQQKLDELKKTIDMNKLKKVIGALTVTKQVTMNLDDFDKAIGITEKKLFVTTLKIGMNYELPVDFIVGEINKNWKIRAVIFE